MRILSTLILLPALLVSACSTTTAKLEESPSTKVGATTYSENYQEIFRRVHDAANQCAGGAINAYASTAVIGQLYNELGYGEITFSMTNVGVKNYYWKARIDKVGAGSSMVVHSGNTINNSMWLDKVVRWAAGDPRC